MKRSRQKKNGSGGTAEAMQSRLEKVFKLPGESTSLNVFSRDDKGRLQYLDSIPLSDVTASTLLDVIKDGYGGGRFQIVPVGGDKKAGESFEVSVHGESKLTRKKTPDDSERGQKRSTKQSETDKELAEVREKLRELEEKGRDDRLLDRVREEIEKAVKRDGSGEVVDAVLKNLPQLVAGVSGLFGKRESAADMLEKVSTIWKNVESSMPQSDPIAQAKDMADLIFTIGNQSNTRAPVSATGPAHTGGAIASFLASVIAEFEKKYLGGMAATSAGGGPVQVPALASAGPGFAGSPEASPKQTGSSGFPGAATEPDAATEQPLDILAGFDMKSLGVDPLATVREMLASRRDPENLGEVIVYSLNFVGTFAVPDSAIAVYIQNFFAHPGMMFDQLAPLIPELHGATAEYLSDLRAAIIEEAKTYARDGAEQAAAQADEGEEKTLTPDQRQAQEKASRERQNAEEVEHGEPESEVVAEEAQPVP